VALAVTAPAVHALVAPAPLRTERGRVARHSTDPAAHFDNGELLSPSQRPPAGRSPAAQVPASFHDSDRRLAEEELARCREVLAGLRGRPCAGPDAIEQSLEVLRALDRIAVDAGLLMVTGIGREVNQAAWRRHSAPGVASAATALVAKWRQRTCGATRQSHTRQVR